MMVKIPLWLIIVGVVGFLFFRNVWTDPRNPVVYDQIIMETVGLQNQTTLPARTILMAADDVPLECQNALIGMYNKTPVRLVFVPADDLSAKNIAATRARYGKDIHVLRFSEPHYKYDSAGVDVIYIKPGQTPPAQGAMDMTQAISYKTVYTNNKWEVKKFV
jgi:hypothetical protein